MLSGLVLIKLLNVTNILFIKHLIKETVQEVHGSRIKFYCDESLNVTSELLTHIGANGVYLEVSKIIDHRFNNLINKWELLINWKGLESFEDS